MGNGQSGKMIPGPHKVSQEISGIPLLLTSPPSQGELSVIAGTPLQMYKEDAA